MALVSTVLTQALYKLRDPNGSNYNKDGAYAEMLGYLNEALVQLDLALSSIGSDLVYQEDATKTLLLAGTSVTIPTRMIVLRDVWISTTQLTKKDHEFIYYERQFSSAGQPSYYALQGSYIIFERAAAAAYALKIHFDQKASPIVATTDDMPYSDEFNEPLTQAVVLLAKNRNEKDIGMDAVLFNMFQTNAMGKALRRDFIPKKYKLDF